MYPNIGQRIYLEECFYGATALSAGRHDHLG